MSRQTMQERLLLPPMPDVLADLFQSLRNSMGASPDPGFFERLMRRIECTPPASIWSFTQTRSSLNPVFALGALTLLFAAFAFLQESTVFGEQIAGTESTTTFPVTGTSSQQRDAVLLNIAAYCRVPRHK
jgi:hypothetical protein